MKEFCGIRAKAYGYLSDDDSEHKNAEGIKKCVIKRKIMFENYEDLKVVITMYTLKKSIRLC